MNLNFCLFSTLVLIKNTIISPYRVHYLFAYVYSDFVCHIHKNFGSLYLNKVHFLKTGSKIKILIYRHVRVPSKDENPSFESNFLYLLDSKEKKEKKLKYIMKEGP